MESLTPRENAFKTISTHRVEQYDELTTELWLVVVSITVVARCGIRNLAEQLVQCTLFDPNFLMLRLPNYSPEALVCSS